MEYYPLPDGQTITSIEIIVETKKDAPPYASAVAQIDYIQISQATFTATDILPSFLASSLHTKYTILNVDDTLMNNLNAYL